MKGMNNNQKFNYLENSVNIYQLTPEQALFIAQKENIQEYIQQAEKLKKEDNLYKKYNSLMLNMSKEQKEQYLINCVNSGKLTVDQALYISVLENLDH
jgi:hypothetical protein